MYETDDESSSQSGLETSVQDDQVAKHASTVNGYELMAENLHDASTEDDGGRLIGCWKFLLLHFRRNEYALEAFQLISQTSAMFSPQKAHQVTWNHTKVGHGNKLTISP